MKCHACGAPKHDKVNLPHCDNRGCDWWICDRCTAVNGATDFNSPNRVTSHADVTAWAAKFGVARRYGK